MKVCAEAEQELRITEELNRRIVEAMPGGFVHVAADGSIRTANAEALRVLGTSFDEIQGKYTQDWDPVTLWEDGTPCGLEEYPVTRALTTGAPRPTVTIGVRRPDGEVAWAVFTAVPVLDPEGGDVTGAVVTFLDITERKRAEEKLRHSEARLRSVVQSAPAFILMADLGGSITFVNRTVPGLSRDDVLGRSLYGFVRDEDHTRVRAIIEGVAASGQPDGYEIRSPKAVGNRLYNVRVGPVSVDEEIQGLTLVFWDITEQRELEGRLLVSDRMASVGTLAAGVAHEINNPLTYLLAALEWMRQNFAGFSPLLAQRIDEALEGAERIKRVVRDLGSYSHARDTRVTSLDVHAVLEEAARMAHNEIRHRARLERDFQAVDAVLADRSRLGQVFLNLLVNAVQAIPAGDHRGNEIRLSTRDTGEGRVRVSIADTGGGIERELLGRIFDPFVTSKPPGVGNGLGLYICHNIVQALGGNIWVDTTPGVGTTFHVDLPAAGPGVCEASPAIPEAAAPELSRAQLLVVDDEPNIRAFLRDSLQPHEVATAPSGHDALAMLRGGHFDAVLCNLIMPDLAGMDLYAQALVVNPELRERFIFMTGAAFTSQARDFVREVQQPVLRKPFSAADVDRALRTVLGPTRGSRP